MLNMYKCVFDGTSTISGAVSSKGYLQVNYTNIQQYTNILINQCVFKNLYAESIPMININTAYLDTTYLDFEDSEIEGIQL